MTSEIDGGGGIESAIKIIHASSKDYGDCGWKTFVSLTHSMYEWKYSERRVVQSMKFHFDPQNIPQSSSLNCIVGLVSIKAVSAVHSYSVHWPRLMANGRKQRRKTTSAFVRWRRKKFASHENSDIASKLTNRHCLYVQTHSYISHRALSNAVNYVHNAT